MDAFTRTVQRRRIITEVDRIKCALVNVSTLAKTSDYYNPDRDISDIELIESIVKKEIPIKPEVIGDGYADGELVYDTWVCPRCGKHYEIAYEIFDYCPNCGQHIDKSVLEEEEEETE